MVSKRLRKAIAKAIYDANGGLSPIQISQILLKKKIGSECDQDSLYRRIRYILINESSKQNGVFFRKRDGSYDLRERRRLRRRVLIALKRQGFIIQPDGSIKKPPMEDKDALRTMHSYAREAKYKKNKKFIIENQSELSEFFADGKEIKLKAFQPEIKVVLPNSKESRLFRYATLLWSVPVSEGFGRRMRFIVKDKSNGKLIGIFALGDPVFNLKCRDDFIGWTASDRGQRLYNVMDVFILGAVPPYNSLLCGKLIALAAVSNEVRNKIARRYKDSKTVIEKKEKDPRLVLMTTGSALGRSSIYDRIKFNDTLLYQRIGTSEGWGHFHMNGRLFEEMKQFVSKYEPRKASSNRFGQGPNWKIRITRKCLQKLSLPPNLLQHGISREIYLIPLASNYKEFLKGKDQNIERINLPFNELVALFKERWFYGRAKRRPEFREFKHTSIPNLINSNGTLPAQMKIDK